MPSQKPHDFGEIMRPRRHVSPAERFHLSLGAFTANTTVTPAPRILFDRQAVIREIWISGDAIPSDPDGTMLLNALVNDVSEGGDDTLVSSQDLETLLAAANRAYKATLAAEGTENERTVNAGDTLRFTLVSNSAAITTNPNLAVEVVVQFIGDVKRSD